MPPPLITNEWFKGKKRPSEFGSVTITFEEIAHVRGAVVRTVSVSGIVAVGSTKGRPGAPEPRSGIRVSTAKNVPSAYHYDPETGDNAYNTGFVDAEKGHIMALELGGPDLADNIVPQWAKWQGSGEWRQVEVAIKKMADEAYESKTEPHYLQFHGMVGYLPMKKPQYALQHRLLFPNHFKVVVTKLDMKTKEPFGTPVVMYDKSPQRNTTDDMMALRTMVQVDKRSLGDSFEGYSDWVEKEEDSKGKNKRKRDAGHFLDGQQDSLHAGIPPVAYRNTSPTRSSYDTGVGAQFEANKRVKLSPQPMDVES